jgi:hypothetical protein
MAPEDGEASGLLPSEGMFQFRPASRLALFLAMLGGAAFGPLPADEKIGMPDLSQVEQTCLPTSTANLMIWFGRHGYPKLVASGESEDEKDLHTVHRLMMSTDARFDLGTQMDDVTVGIEKYIRDCGYDCDVEYRGLGGKGPTFTSDWLKENDNPNKGFVLVLLYCHVDSQSRRVSPMRSGHAVTLVNFEPGLLLVHDPAHYDDETGRKILTPHFVPNTDPTNKQSELIFLSGSLLDAPPTSLVLLAGAVCVTMHPEGELKVSSQAEKTTSEASASGASVDHAHGRGWFGWLAGVLGY